MNVLTKSHYFRFSFGPLLLVGCGLDHERITELGIGQNPWPLAVMKLLALRLLQTA